MFNISFGNVEGRSVNQPERSIKRSADQLGASASKRIKICDEPIYNPPLIKRGESYFIVGDLDANSGIVCPPDSEARKAINDFQVENLETRHSKVHNEGVHLKRTRVTQPIEKLQVVAVYEGHPLRARLLTDEELTLTGLNNTEQVDPLAMETESAAATAPAASDSDAEQKPIKQLVWYDYKDQPVLINRPTCFQSYCSDFKYPDSEGRMTWLGSDAIDSQFPISNINCYYFSNIVLVPCLKGELVQSRSEEETILQSPPDEGDYCILAVAKRLIQPGEELLVDYQAGVRVNNKKAHFWAPDEYFFPAISPVPVDVTFSADGSTANVSAKEDTTDRNLDGIKDEIAKCYDQRLSVSQLIHALSQGFTNPLTGKDTWTPGCIQRLCELWNVERFRQPYYLTYLCHCLNGSGRLDNHGFNYIKSFIRARELDIEPPACRLGTMNDIISWLETALDTLRENPESIENRDGQLKILNDELQLLRLWKHRRLCDGPEKTASFELQKKQVEDFVTTELASITERKKEVSLSFPWERITSNYLMPDEFCPDKLRPSIWRKAHIRCMPMFSRVKPVEGLDPDPLDILACFKPETAEYAAAMKDALRRRQEEGESLENIKSKMNNSGLRSARRTGTSWEHIPMEYEIPYVEGIPEELSGTPHWGRLTPEEWHILGFEQTTDSPVKKAIERFVRENSYDAARRAICSEHHRHVWENDDNIKPALKEKPVGSWSFINHLTKYSGANVSDPKYTWEPMDTLKVCSAGTPHYEEAMKQLLQEQHERGANAHEIADILNQKGVSTSLTAEKKAASRVEVPEKLGALTEWTGQAVVGLCKQYSMPIPELPEQTMDTQGLIQVCIDGSKSGTADAAWMKVRKLLLDNEPLREAVREELNLDPSKLVKPRAAIVRYILSELKIRIKSPAIREALALRGGDKLSSILRSHPDWHDEVSKLASWFKDNGHNCRVTAEAFNKGNSKPAKYEVTFDSIPVPEGSKVKSWNGAMVSPFTKGKGKGKGKGASAKK